MGDADTKVVILGVLDVKYWSDHVINTDNTYHYEYWVDILTCT